MAVLSVPVSAIERTCDHAAMKLADPTFGTGVVSLPHEPVGEGREAP